MDTRAKLIQAAIDVLQIDQGATTEKIAEVAGVTRRTLHRYFSSKDDLLVAVSGQMVNTCIANVKNAMNASELPEEQLKLMFHSDIDCGYQYAFIHDVSKDMPSYGKQTQEDFNEMMNTFKTVILNVKESAKVSPHVTVGWMEYAYYGLLEGATRALRDGAVAPRDIKKMAWRSYWNGIKKE